MFLQEVHTAQGQQLQLQGEQQNSAAGSYVVRDDTSVMQQVRRFEKRFLIYCVTGYCYWWRTVMLLVLVRIATSGSRCGAPAGQRLNSSCLQLLHWWGQWSAACISIAVCPLPCQILCFGAVIWW
jgi:hypothetical protein